jgi:hypothetical protein
VARHSHDVVVSVQSYIAHPYWPEREKLINIIKESGMSRARSSANRQKALSEYLKREGISTDQYEELERLASRQFYTAPDGTIIIPSLHVISMIVNAVSNMRAQGRPFTPEQARTMVQAGPWVTDRTEPDGTWERFAVVTSGSGAKLSNQRALRSNEYIGSPPGTDGPPVTAVGTFIVDDAVNITKLHETLSYAGEMTGIGASRKMGWGRFEVVSLS